MEARACRTLFPQPIGQLDAALAAQYRLLAIYSNSIGPFDRYVLKDTGRYITILLDPGGFLNRLGADLILIPPREHYDSRLHRLWQKVQRGWN
jgi:hypothetical protein